MVAIYPNIVPENNLRLPDALVIKHGPTQLLGRFILEADKAAREAGLRLRLRHDFDELNRINQQEVKSGNWYPLINMFNPERDDIAPENAFWLSGENELGEIVTTFATRIYYWPDTNLEEQAVAMLYGRDEGQRCIITADAAKLISGVVMSSGAAWVRPDYRRRGLRSCCRGSPRPMRCRAGRSTGRSASSPGFWSRRASPAAATAPGGTATACGFPTCRSASWWSPIPRCGKSTRIWRSTWPPHCRARAARNSPPTPCPAVSRKS
jgi:hypothetical protein